MLPYGRNLLRQNMLAHHSIEDSLKRLRDEREQADRLYNDALTALDSAIERLPALPNPPALYDDHQITPLNSRWNLLAFESPAVRKGLRGRFYSAVWRLVVPVFQRQQEFNAAVVDHLNRNVRHHRDTQQTASEMIVVMRRQLENLAAFQTRLMVYLQQITLYVDTKDRDVAGIRLPLAAAISAVGDELHKRWEAIGILQQATLSMKRELERLAANGGRQDAAGLKAGTITAGLEPGTTNADGVDVAPGFSQADAYKYVGFEDRYRGSREAVREKLEPYVTYFRGAANVLDVGCGRGEFLELLREHGIPARGIDTNRDMVALCRSAGLEADEGDALTYVKNLPDGSLGGLFSSQLIEHLEPGYLMRLLEAAYHALKPGSTMVLETINPASWAAFFGAYIRDITHAQPIHPETLSYLASASGFVNVNLRYSAPFSEPEKLQAAPGETADPVLRHAIDTYNANVDKLNSLLFTYRDYAVIGERIG
jgi:SAM-dependent methyltransferase